MPAAILQSIRNTVGLTPCPQEIEAAPATAQRFSVGIDLVESKSVCAQACALATEAFLINLLQDKQVDAPTKKKKIEREISLLHTHASLFGEAIQLHNRVMHESTTFVLR